MRELRLVGGPADGREVEHTGGAFIIVPELANGPRLFEAVRDDDQFIMDEFGFVRWVREELNPHFNRHRYNGRTGEYEGVE